MTHSELVKRFIAVLNNHSALEEFKENLGDGLDDDFDIYLAMTAPMEFLSSAFFWVVSDGNPYKWAEINEEWLGYLELVSSLESATSLNTNTQEE